MKCATLVAKVLQAHKVTSFRVVETRVLPGALPSESYSQVPDKDTVGNSRIGSKRDACKPN